ncbi:hypothetical protein WA026_004216 [Henosepilachna vigintioctopunctata]|uniref:Uncharacterized protein n=1 Tax=Henosepilachna vigintioctopunctata TaxID=420089 RepID=A0AAW1U9N2_9CUCU
MKRKIFILKSLNKFQSHQGPVEIEIDIFPVKNNLVPIDEWCLSSYCPEVDKRSIFPFRYRSADGGPMSEKRPPQISLLLIPALLQEFARAKITNSTLDIVPLTTSGENWFFRKAICLNKSVSYEVQTLRVKIEKKRNTVDE